MSVLIICMEEAEAAAMVRWGLRFADSKELALDVLLLTESSNASPLKEIESTNSESNPLLAAAMEGAGDRSSSIGWFRAAHRNPASVALSCIAERNTTLVIACKHRSKKEDATTLAATTLIEKAPCNVLLLRLGKTDGTDTNKILIPAGGGDHSRAALQWVAPWAEQREAAIVPLMIVGEGSPEATDAGEIRLQKILDDAGLPHDEHIQPRVEVDDDVWRAIGAVAHEDFDLLLVGASEEGPVRRILFGTVPDRLLANEEGLAVGVFRSARPLRQRIRQRLGRWLHLTIPQLNRNERVTLYENLRKGSRWNFDFFALLSLSTAIAALGLLQSSAAVVIGAMLVAPLMTPLLGAGLALVQGNIRLLRESARSVLFGFLSALLIGWLLGVITSPPELTPELLARGSPTILDLGIALLSGIAAAYCVGRPTLSGALPGVAIAAALVPPIATTGIALALQAWDVARGSALLFGTNVVAIVLGAAISLYLGGIRATSGPKGGPAWARRILWGLLAIVALEAVPLGTYLLAGWQGRGRLAHPVSDGLREQLRTLLADHDSRLVSIAHAPRTNQEPLPSLILRVEGPRQLSDGLRTQILELCRTHVGPGIPVRMRTDLVLQAVTPASPKPQLKPAAPE